MSHPIRNALLLIDMQHGLYHAPDAPWQREALLANIQLLVNQARTAGAPVLAARHTGPAGSPIAAGSASWQLLPELGLDPAHDYLFDKTRPDCFAGTGLKAWLQAHNISQLVLAGMKTQYCVDTTCRAANLHGLQCVLAADAHSCMDTPQLAASQIIAHHNATLHGAFAQVLPSSQIVFQA
ncbi:cysteine hydrolase family protein [Vogesella sp. DC21W]|uniref:Cysteine hydrolase family protein n=1 Tax=Vogesella aquatica TaxID=2984206 RepID=A0ABT5ITB6_9NEIS|nr:cysteine hydrolase family protein [Vogesella aquatica]MDC7715808.1 cysteine hydrolase family protein [Vogesella aquatica]